MSRIASAFIPALIAYYGRLADDPNQAVADYGFSREKLHFVIVLERDGTLASINEIRLRNEKGKPVPNVMLVPDGGGRSGTLIRPFFCWDNTGYALGCDNKKNPERAAEMFAAFRDLHLCFRDELAGDEDFSALCRFLERWQPADAEKRADWEEIAGQNVVFKIRGKEGYVHSSEAVRSAWLKHIAKQGDDESRVRGISLISGQEEEIARLHPLISGVAGSNTMGAAVVSFNLVSFESYGKSQGYNAPMGSRDVFRYTTALNSLLGDKAHRARIGDATVVYWSDRPGGLEHEELIGQMFGEDTPKDNTVEHKATVARIRSFLEAARTGRLADLIEDPGAPFYILGLSPNASRLSVRYWLTGTVKQFAERLAQHVAQLEMTGARPDDPPLMIRRLLLETAREPKDIAPQLAGEVARAVLAGLPYPEALFNAVVRRVRTDSIMNHRRAAILKAYLIRNRGKEVPVALDKDHTDEAYQLGRLFATLEFAQTNALGDLNRSIKDAFFGSAAATPSIVFPRLMRLHQHHIEKLPTSRETAQTEKKRTKKYFEKLVQEICSHITRFPPHLTLERQGLFHIAYFHQRQDFFTKRTETNKGDDE